MELLGRVLATFRAVTFVLGSSRDWVRQRVAVHIEPEASTSEREASPWVLDPCPCVERGSGPPSNTLYHLPPAYGAQAGSSIAGAKAIGVPGLGNCVQAPQ